MGDQCEKGYICCPYAKICIKSCSDAQGTCSSHEKANCYPKCPDNEENLENCNCKHSDFPAKWGSPTCADADTTSLTQSISTIPPPTTKLTVCPDNFPTIERHTESNHGDVCRNEKYHGFNVGWVCPEGCKESPNNAPYCAMSTSDNSPCRVNVADCTPKKSVGNCGKCFSGDQCIEGYCCPFMRVCVETSTTTCRADETAQCTSACRDNMDQNECICGNKSFPEKWAKPTCGGSTGE